MSSDKNNQSFASRMLLKAADKCNLNDIQAALDLGADPSATDEHERTPLMLMAAGAGSAIELEMLIKVSNLDAQDSDGWTAILWALNFNPVVFESLLSAGANPRIADCDGETPLMRAAFVHNMDAVKRLAPLSDLAAKDDEDHTAESRADSEGFCEIADYLRAAALAKKEAELLEMIASEKSPAGKAAAIRI